MRLVIEGEEKEDVVVPVRLTQDDTDINVEAHINGIWRLVAWFEPNGDIWVVDQTDLPSGFTNRSAKQ